MRHLTEKQKSIYDSFHYGTHLFKRIPYYKEVADSKNITIPSLANHLELIKMKGYLVEFIYCPYCGEKLDKPA